MKKIISAALLTLALGGAHAQAYIGATFGASNLNLDCAGAVACDDKGSGYKVYGGYSFTKGFALEGGYLDFGKASGSAYAYALGANRLVNLELETTAFFLAAAVRGDFTPNFGGAARLGLASVKTDVTGFVPSLNRGVKDSSSAGKAYFGLSLDYAFTKNLKGVVAADFTTTDIYEESAAVRMISIGAQYDF